MMRQRSQVDTPPLVAARLDQPGMRPGSQSSKPAGENGPRLVAAGYLAFRSSAYLSAWKQGTDILGHNGPGCRLGGASELRVRAYGVLPRRSRVQREQGGFGIIRSTRTLPFGAPSRGDPGGSPSGD